MSIGSDRIQEILIFGTGKRAFKITKMLEISSVGYRIKIYVDNDKEKCEKMFLGKGVISPEKIREYMDDSTQVVLSMDKFQEVEKQLLSMGISHEKIITYDDFCDLWSERNILNVKRNIRKCYNTIRVGFVVQEIQSWGKMAPIYEKMLTDKNFYPILLVVPSYDFCDNKMKKASQYDEFAIKYPGEEMYLWNNEMNIDDYLLNYIFLPAPYDAYMPEGLKSSLLVRYALLCYIPYGHIGADNFIECNTEKTFFRNIYLNFVHTKKTYDVFYTMFSDCVIHNSKIIKKIGYLPFADYNNRGLSDDSQNVILWTPRWSYDPVIGGSHFFEYKDFIFEVHRIFQDYQLMVRPHPMMFDNFVSKGLMTSDDITDYKTELVRCGIILDENTELEDIARKTAILITDFSSIIPDFFIRGCPIIYCDSPVIHLNEEYNYMLKGCYIAKNEEEIKHYLEIIIFQGDPLADVRMDIRNELLEHAKNGINDCLNLIKKDYFNSK